MKKVNEDFFGKSQASIRLNDNAGNDDQPDICLTGDKAKLATELAGTGKKVTITYRRTLEFKNIYTDCIQPEITINEDK